MKIDSKPAAGRPAGPPHKDKPSGSAPRDKLTALAHSLKDRVHLSEGLNQLKHVDAGPVHLKSLIEGLASWTGHPSGTLDRSAGQSPQLLPLDEAPPTDGPAELGLRAKEYGRDGKAINPNTGNTNWNLYCLGWTNQALKSQGQSIPELQAPDARTAYERAKANGKVQYGDPPPGAIVFYPQLSQYGHVGIVNEDGTSYRGTVPPTESRTTLGDRPIPNRSQVAWMYPQ